MKILITGGKSSKSYKILKAFSNYQIILADYGEVPSITAGSQQLISLGERNDEITAHHILTACLDQQIDYLLPLHEFEIHAVSKSMILFEEFGITVLLPAAIDLPNYFYDQEDTSKGNNWAVYIKGDLIYSTESATYVADLGRMKYLTGVFYVSEEINDLTAVLFTID